jgi:hypothetical protein
LGDGVKPHFGHTRHGLAVHLHTIDHHPDGTPWQRFNKATAEAVTGAFSTMTSFWVCTLLCLLVLPSVLYAMGIKHVWFFPSWMLGFGFELLATWFLSTTLELVLMPAVMVKQRLQDLAADARAAKTFEEIEDIKGSQEAMRADIAGMKEALAAALAARERLRGSPE